MSGGRRRQSPDDGGLGCLVMIILALIAMPLVGLYLALSSKTDDETKVIGWIMVVMGCGIWIFAAVKGEQ